MYSSQNLLHVYAEWDVIKNQVGDLESFAFHTHFYVKAFLGPHN